MGIEGQRGHRRGELERARRRQKDAGNLFKGQSVSLRSVKLLLSYRNRIDLELKEQRRRVTTTSQSKLGRPSRTYLAPWGTTAHQKIQQET